MMTANDIGNLFQSMRIAYGAQWKHGEEAISVWREALKHETPEAVHRAANKVLSIYVDHPPTLPQFLQVVRPPKSRSTYLEPPKRSNAQLIGNRLLRRNLQKQDGVDSKQLRIMVDLKNAIVDECEDVNPSKAWIIDLDEQLYALAAAHDPAAKAIEAEQAREKYCRRQGMRFVPREMLEA